LTLDSGKNGKKTQQLTPVGSRTLQTYLDPMTGSMSSPRLRTPLREKRRY
jgi:hypothetical protein